MMDRDEILRQVPGWDMERIRAAQVLVVGAGALGNEVLKNLALLNVGQVAILDFDRVEPSNLSRSVLFRPEDALSRLPKAEVAAHRLLDLNPEMSILSLNGDVMTDLGLGFLCRMDVVIGCVDNRLARLYLNRWCFRVGVPWVNGGILNLSGQVSAYRMGDGCYECGLNEQGWRDIRARMGCADMARRYAMGGNAPTTPIAASVAGAMQVQEALRLLHGGEGGLVGRMFHFEGQNLHAEVYELLPPRAECDSHFRYDPVVEVAGLSVQNTLGEVLGRVEELLGLEAPQWEPDHPVATELATLQTKRRIPMVIPQPMLSDRVVAALGGQGEGIGIPKGKLLSRIGRGSGLEDRRLTELGVPHGHILTIREGRKRYFVELSGDLDAMRFERGHRKLPNPWFEYVP